MLNWEPCALLHLMSPMGCDNMCESESTSQVLNIPPPLYSEIPGTVPLSNALENSPPPSYEEVVNPEASPPTYQSLFGQVREARKNSSGFMDFVKKVVILLLGTIGCSIILGITIVVPISMILVGTNYFGECPVEQFIPVYLIVGGTFGVVKNVLGFFSRWKTNENEQERLIHRSRDSILNCFLIAWFITDILQEGYEREWWILGTKKILIQNKGSLIKKYYPSINVRLSGHLLFTNYKMIQFFTEHGNFKSCSNKFNLVPSSYNCGVDVC
ncbi:uncharacterized protein TNCV_1706631 [Trichonephila clavipes]|uniref:Transmembrane protein n=1 Tax=Trichonephila clavipes TaxID=2585209 RepID=A0A8X6V250_TRICX|nr:uncharacterized protein TNCV_1706631 [Trichonephila clavipes]